MFELRKLPVRVFKGDYDPQLIQVVLSENRIVFEFPKAVVTAGAASAPISDLKPSHNGKIETSDKPYPKDSGRQMSFEALICVLASNANDGNGPVCFIDLDGKKKRLDKTCAEWAVQHGNFFRVELDDGQHALRPR